MDEGTRLYHIRKTILQMLSDRGYMITNSELELTKEDFKKDFTAHNNSREHLNSSYNKKDDAADRIFTFFPADVKVGVTPIRKFVDQMKGPHGGNRAIIIVQSNLTAFAKQALSEFSQAKKIVLEQFNEAELLVNITHHQLVPKHILLTKEEKKELLTRYKMKETQLPRVQMNDPVARYFGLARGDVVKIIRPSETAGRYITYSNISSTSRQIIEDMIDIMLNASCSSTSSSLENSPRYTSRLWRLEDGKSSELDKSDDSIGIDAVIENPEECVLWYFTYFLGKKHSNFLGTAETIDKVSGVGTGVLEVFGASVLKEHTENGDYSYKIIVFTTTGIERQMFHARPKHTLSPSELIKKTAPHLIIKKVKEIETPGLLQDFKQLESTQTELSYKFGILLAKPGQNHEDQFYDNCIGSERYHEFLKNLGDTIPLNGFKGFRGGLDVINDTTGKESIFTTWNDYQIMFHVSTMLPYMQVYSSQHQQQQRHLEPTPLNGNSSQQQQQRHLEPTPLNGNSTMVQCQLDRKRHLGNDIVMIIFYDAETDDDVISWDPSSVNSKFNHIFAMVKPQGDDGYKVEFIIKNTIATFGPKVPNPSYFQKGDSFKNFLLAKLINGQRAALQSSSFSKIIQRTFQGQLQNIYDKYNQSSIIPRRRSASGNNIMIGKELKEKEYVKNPLSSTLKNMLSRPAIFETEILLRNYNDSINCLDVVESEDSICILVFATNEAIFIFKTNSNSQEPPTYQKVMSIKDVSKLTFIKQLNVLIALTPKGIHVYDMIGVMTYYRHRVDQRLPDRSSDEPSAKRLSDTKGCTEYAYTKNDDDSGITLLYVAVRKTIYQFEWCRNQFVKNKELVMSIPSDQIIKTMCSVGPGMVCVGVSSQFLLVDMFTGMVKDLYRKVDSEPVMALCTSAQEVLLCFNNIGFFVNERGTRTRTYDLKWGSIPSSLLLLPNYIVAISGALIEIRTLINGNIIQSIPTSSLNTSSSSNVNMIINNNAPITLLNGSGGFEKDNVVNLGNSNGSTPNSSPSPILQWMASKEGSITSTSTSTSMTTMSASMPIIPTITLLPPPFASPSTLPTFSSHNSFNTFNGMAYSDSSGNIYVASSSKGSCIIRLKASQSSSLILSPPSSPSVQYLKDTKGILSISTIDRL
ncbi:RapGAP/RanGAP domain-containing protein [Cavenderia fasciculata]|uniref:RapGAP/RanGAP domain-containing protein n=1 Tax=Cavenderia fasciculata TaxID=261658 RepID=F4QDK5_CACFS|nr:RapGAP/RanGAP domain-containing protein [Cavenderia fasciculata]EGG13802.1 RapGAP/RanGAP domain-containing protein [Cavenderia fasciculata]|eukprot:XP_004350510.1 RapGAP/RanGAP domain-containing protein [Cavenderia fasciculata]